MLDVILPQIIKWKRFKQLFKELKLGKSFDPTGVIREVFIQGSSGLIHSITAMFNAFKKNFDVPSQWDDILITTMFKKKGFWEKLDNY